MGQFSIGQSVRRREDPRLLQGRGRFYDDLKLADHVYAAIVRSPHAHADIKSIDVRAALQMPGVHAVLTGEDYHKDGIGSPPPMGPSQKSDGTAPPPSRTRRSSTTIVPATNRIFTRPATRPKPTPPSPAPPTWSSSAW